MATDVRASADPHHSSPVLGLLDRLLDAGPHDLGLLKVEARKLRDAMVRLGDAPPGRATDASVPRSAYDAWVVELFHATETAVPREALLRDFAQRFAQVHGLDQSERGARIIVLHYLAAQGGAPAQVSGFFQQGMAVDQWRRFQQQLAKHHDDPALQRLFVQRERFERDYLPYMLQGGFYRGVFDSALARGKNARTEDWADYGPNAWMTAQALFGDDLREGHAIVMLYPNEGSYFQYREPARSAQDLRLLDVLAAVYRQLEQQIKNLALQVVRAKEQLLARLGPAVLHHEVEGLARQLRGTLAEAVEDWQQFERVFEPPKVVATLGPRLGLAHDWADKMIATTEAFMNLERRGSVATLNVANLMTQVQRMIVVRSGTIGAALRVEAVLDAEDSLQRPAMLRNDATLIMHALLNLVSNALDAMEPRYLEWQEQRDAARARGETAPEPHQSLVEIRWTRQPLPVGCVGWEVVNTGPPIPGEVRSRIFERGFTTRSAGHGQGLHLVRLTAQYCGGDVALMADSALDQAGGEAVGFLYWVAAEHHASRELSL